MFFQTEERSNSCFINNLEKYCGLQVNYENYRERHQIWQKYDLISLRTVSGAVRSQNKFTFKAMISKWNCIFHNKVKNSRNAYNNFCSTVNKQKHCKVQIVNYRLLFRLSINRRLCLFLHTKPFNHPLNTCFNHEVIFCLRGWRQMLGRLWLIIF